MKCLACLFLFMVGLMYLLLMPGCQANEAHFPEPDTLPRQIKVDYTWIGLNPYTLREQFELNLNTDRSSYQVRGAVMKLSQLPENTDSVAHVERNLSVETVESLLNTMHKAQWEAVDKPTEMIDHTDDYPNYNIEFRMEDGQSFRIRSTSNTQAAIPWNLFLSNRIYSTHNAALGQKIKMLYEQLRPEGYDPWKN
jgi:hypothetical protein